MSRSERGRHPLDPPRGFVRRNGDDPARRRALNDHRDPFGTCPTESRGAQGSAGHDRRGAVSEPTVSRVVGASARVYGWLLRAYPTSFRRRFGREMSQVFRAACRDADRRRGVAGLWLLTLADLATSLPAELATAAACEGGRAMRSIVDVRTPLNRQAWLVGIAVGLLRIAYELATNALDPDALGGAPTNTGLLVGLVALFGLAGWRGATITGRVTPGMRTALLAAAIGSAIGIVSLWVVTFAFMDTIRHNPGMLQDFARSGGQDLDAFIVGDALGATVVSLVASFVLGCGAGVGGGLVGKALRAGTSQA